MATPKLAHRSPRISTPPVLTRAIPFYPAKLSDAELSYLLDHLEDPPTVALQGELPEGVNPHAIEHALQPMYDLEQLRLHRGIAWAGFDRVRDVVLRYQAWQELSKDIRSQGGPRHPSMHSWDSQGSMSKGTPGTDSSDIVRTEILDDGSRRPLYIDDLRRPLQAKGSVHLPWVKRVAQADTDAVEHDDVKGLLTCTVCGHVVSYKTGMGRERLNLARGQMARHLKGTRKESNRHRALYRREFK